MIDIEKFIEKHIALRDVLVNRYDLFMDGFAQQLIDVLDDYIELRNDWKGQQEKSKIAKTLLEELVDNVTTYNSESDTYSCRYCGAWMFTTENVDHEANCPVTKTETFLKDLR